MQRTVGVERRMETVRGRGEKLGKEREKERKKMKKKENEKKI